MERQLLIKRTLENISLLPDNKLLDVAEYVEFLLKRRKDKKFIEGIQKLEMSSGSFDFLKEEEELYNDSDIIEKYWDNK